MVVTGQWCVTNIAAGGSLGLLTPTLVIMSLTDGVEQGGAGGLDHHVRVEEDSLEQGLGEGGQLGDQRGEAEVDAESIVRKVAYPEH